MSADFTILSLDLGSNFGWAIGKNGVITASGEVPLTRSQDSHPGMRWMRFQEFLYKHRDVNEIIFENVKGSRSHVASMVYGKLKGDVETFVLANGIRLSCLTPGEIKSDFTGNGNAKKEIMCEVAMNLGWKHGMRGTRDFNDECDAIALMWVIYSRRGITPRFI